MAGHHICQHQAAAQGGDDAEQSQHQRAEHSPAEIISFKHVQKIFQSRKYPLGVHRFNLKKAHVYAHQNRNTHEDEHEQCGWQNIDVGRYPAPPYTWTSIPCSPFHKNLSFR